MNREKLISQVKDIYARLASGENKQHITQTTNGITPDMYYENVLNMVIREINAGTFDSFQSGQEIVDAVTKDKDKWIPDWRQDLLS
jgi:glucan phosphorylase